MITERDQSCRQFVLDFKICDSSTLIQEFYPSYRMGAYRLQKMVEQKEIKRDRASVNNEYLYYVKKPENIPHCLMVSHFYRWLKEDHGIEEYRVEPTIKGLGRPDADFIYTDGVHRMYGTLEVEVSNNGFNLDKYIAYFKSGEYKNNHPGTMPFVFLVSKIKNNLKSPITLRGYYFAKLAITDSVRECWA